MAAKTNTHNLTKVLVLLVFALFLGVALWQSQTVATFADNTDVRPPAASPADALQPLQNVPAPGAVNQPVDTPPEGCLKCHNNIEPMHKYNSRDDVYDTLRDGRDAQDLTCTACHGGNPATTVKADAHVRPRFPEKWGCKGNGDCSSRNPERSLTLLEKESREFVRFVNPGDFRVIAQTCGSCHTDETKRSPRSMMAHGAMLWGAALYNNGGFHLKDAHFGESYNEDGQPQALFQSPAPTRQQQAFEGFLTSL
jgi:hypothetical protein